jgi:hypothetical protein
MAQRHKGGAAEEPATETRRAPPEPIGRVRRELVRPDGTKVVVDVPVYPPFRLENTGSAPPPPEARRKRPGAKPRRSDSE